MIRKVGWLLGVVVFASTGVYTVVYVYRWEWNRALFVAILFVAIEVAGALALVLRRLKRIEAKLDAMPGRQTQVAAQLRANAPERKHFAWLERSMGQTNIFVTVLLGAGVLLSGLTWIVDRIATRTALPTLERSLAQRFDAVALPEGPLVPEDAELVAQAGRYADDPDLRILLGPEARR